MFMISPFCAVAAHRLGARIASTIFYRFYAQARHALEKIDHLLLVKSLDDLDDESFSKFAEQS